MQEKILNILSPQKEKEGQKKFESAIRKFLDEQLPENPEDKKAGYGLDFDISAPMESDIRKVQSGNFEITDFRTSPTSNPDKLSFSFCVGNTEFNISGKAADRIYELIEE